MTVRIITSHVLDGLRQLEDESVHCVVTSPPYYGLRDYGIEPQVWGGDPGCEHSWLSEIVPTERGGGNWAQGTNGRGELQPGGVDAKREPLRAITERGFCLHCNAWRGSLGLEPTLDLYLDHMVEVFREIRRVMRKDGTCWLNIGDSYCSIGHKKSNSGYGTTGLAGGKAQEHTPLRRENNGGPNSKLKHKDLMLIPSRLAIRLQEDGWWVRSDIAWCKRAPMPESCTDRPTTAWEHVFLLTKSGAPTYWTHRDHEGTRIKPAPDYRWQRLNDQGEVLFETAEEPPGWREDKKHWRRINLWDAHDYFYDQEAVKEPAEYGRREWSNVAENLAGVGLDGRRGHATVKGGDPSTGRNMRNFWLLGTEPFPEAHFATFPPRIPEICIKAGTSERGVCPKCGAGWERQTKTEYRHHEKWFGDKQGARHSRGKAGTSYDEPIGTETIGWRPTCKCFTTPGLSSDRESGGDRRPPPIPATVLDPFLGAGTTAMVADRLGRHCIGIELSPAYARMGEDRIRSDAGMFAEIAAE